MGLGCRLLSGRGGFTLLELLLVVAVLSAVAWMSLGVVSNNADQVRFEDTRNRLQAIRRAIIGDTSRTINGQPEVRGYVADMGRLPTNLQELIIQGAQPNYVPDADTGIWRGWNGPYLPPGFGNTARYLDGWGNDDGSSDFGWDLNFDTPNAGDLTVKSLGRDGVANGAQPYDADYPFATTTPLIDESEYRILITDSVGTASGDANGGLRVDFGDPASCWVTVPCSNPLYTTQTGCESNAGIWTWGSCSNGTYTTETDCLNNSATWTWGGGCSNPSYTSQTTCESSGATWRWANPRPRADITLSTDCASAMGTWQPSKTLCMALQVIKDGSPVQLLSSRFVQVQWDGTNKVREFIFEDATGPDYDEDTYLYQGQIAWGIFDYDSTSGTCQITKPFPAGSATWKNFTYVPGTTLQPFERKINP